MRAADFRRADDLFADSRMLFGDHLEELRLRLWRALAGFAVIMALVFVLDAVGCLTGTPVGVGKPVLEVIAAPVEQALQQFHQRRVERVLRDLENGSQALQLADEAREVPLELNVADLAAALGLPAPDGEKHFVRIQGRIPPLSWMLILRQAQELVGPRPSLKTFSAMEGMLVYFQVALACGAVLGSPWIFWQLWAFVAAGLYPHEKRYVHVYLPFSLGLFLGGVLVCQFLVMPRAVEALLWFDEWLNFQPDLRLNEWLGFAVLMPLVFGASFQTPLVMLFLERLGVFSVEAYRRHRRVAWFLLAVFAAVITPSVDPWSLLLLWVPMGLLYELGVWLCRLALRPVEEPLAV